MKHNRMRPVNDDKRGGISFIGDNVIDLDIPGFSLSYDRFVDRMTIARSGETLMVDTSIRSFTILFDGHAVEGDWIKIIDAKGTFPQHALYVDSQGNHFINGVTTPVTLNRGLVWEFTFSSSSGWVGVIAMSAVTANASTTDVSTGITLSEAQRAASKMLARYDNDSNGSYVVKGLKTTYVSDSGNKHVFSVSAGLAHIRGIEVTLESTRRLELDTAIDLKEVLAEPQSFTSDGFYTLRHGKIHSVQDVSGIKPISEDIIHGAYNTAPDILPHQPVVSVSAVTQGATTFIENTDWAREGDQIVWDLGGATPSPGSTYHVEYTYQSSITPTISDDETQIYVAGLAIGTPFYVDYQFYLLRQDRIVLTIDGAVSVLKGIPAEFTPKAPMVTEGLSLARVAIERGSNPIVTIDYIRSLPVSELQYLFDRVNALDYNVSILSLQQNATDQDRTTDKRGLFVDPFYDDDLRDAFFDQKAFIHLDNLLFGTTWSTELIYSGTRLMLPYVEQPFIQQLAWSEDSLIEPYAWATAPPATLNCSPRTYSWAASRAYSSIFYGERATGINHGGDEAPSGWYPNGVYTQIRVLNTAIVPSILIALEGKRYNGNEDCEVYFDGVLIKTTPAQADGQFIDTFNVPENTLTGRKEIRVVGTDSKTVGVCFFTSNAYGVFEVRRYIYLYDPIAETFTPAKNAFISSIDVQFGNSPTDKVTLHLVEAQLGLPDRTKGLDSVDKEPEDIVPNVWSGYDFDPIPVMADTEYAMILQTADPAALIHTATMKQWDKANLRHITTQPYEEGVYLESSNISTWNPIQGKDLTFKINRAVFEPSSTFKIGEAEATDCTDVQLLLDAIVYPETDVSFFIRLVDRSNEEYEIAPSKIAVIPKYTGTIEVWATLTTVDDYLSPVLSETVYLGLGTLENPSDYISREFSLEGATRLDIYLDLYEDSGASTLVYYRSSGEGDTAVWSEIPRQNAKPIGDAYYETYFSVSGLAVEETQIRIVYTTTNDTKRAVAKNLRAIFIVE